MLASLISRLLNYAVYKGIDKETLLKKIGFTDNLLADPEEQLELATLERMVMYTDEILGDPALALTALRHIGLDAVGVVGHIMQNSANLEQAIALQMKFQPLIGNVGIITLDRAPGILYWCWKCQSQNAVFVRHATEFTLGLWTLLTTGLKVGSQPALLGVQFCHPAPEDPDLATVYESHFGCPVYFNREKSGLLLVPEALRIPITGVNANLHTTLEHYASFQLKHQKQIGQLFAEKVRAHLRLHLRQSTTSREAIADDLNISTRTLSRQLKQEGYSYRELLDDVRLELAKTYLEDATITIEEVAQRLGFSRSSAFITWFRPLGGCTPGEYQRKRIPASPP